MTVEWVEVKGRTVEVAVAAALAELGLDSEERAEVEVLQEPEKGFLGFGGQDAIVRVKPKAGGRRRRGGRHRGKKNREAKKDPAQPPPKSPASAPEKEEAAVTELDPEEQAEVVQGFLSGLLKALGLEGQVTTTVEDDIVLADVQGEQTGALVGERASIMQAVHELTRTVVQRRTKRSIRLRLDIAGYAQRRREALAIYAARLAEQVKDEGQEIMLEPMNAADRKVIHDAIAEIEGVRTYSEGEEPHRSVVVAPAEEPES